MPLPPGPAEPPFVQLLEWIGRPIPFLERCARRYGDVFTVRLPGVAPFVFFSQPDAVRDLLTGDPEDLRGGEANEILRHILGDHSILLLDGARHLRERKLMMPPFHGERMRAYGQVMTELADQVVDRLPNRTPFPIHRKFQAVTLDVILRIVFGIDAGPRLTRGRALLTRFTDLGSSSLATKLLFLLQSAHARRILELGMGPVTIAGRSIDLSRLVPWRGAMQASRDVKAFLHEEIAARRAAEGAREDVLSLLLAARDDEGRGLSDEELHDEMLTLLIAGHETSATTLAWAVHHLVEHPAILQRVHAELTHVGGGRPIAPDDTPRLELLDAVIKETLRLTPTIGMVGRRLHRDLEIGGRALPVGCTAVACIYLTHRRPELWPEPARFDPDRFVGKKLDPYTYYPFGGGVRRCLGMALAGYEMRIVLARFLSRRTLSAAPGRRVGVVRRGVAFAPSAGVRVIADARVA